MWLLVGRGGKILEENVFEVLHAQIVALLRSAVLVYRFLQFPDSVQLRLNLQLSCVQLLLQRSPRTDSLRQLAIPRQLHSKQHTASSASGPSARIGLMHAYLQLDLVQQGFLGHVGSVSARGR